MKTRGVIGQRIVHVEQYRSHNYNTGQNFVGVAWIDLENGVRLIPHTIEPDDRTSSDYRHEFIITKPTK